VLAWRRTTSAQVLWLGWSDRGEFEEKAQRKKKEWG
jgi:hypothetical protein